MSEILSKYTEKDSTYIQLQVLRYLEISPQSPDGNFILETTRMYMNPPFNLGRSYAVIHAMMDRVTGSHLPKEQRSQTKTTYSEASGTPDNLPDYITYVTPHKVVTHAHLDSTREPGDVLICDFLTQNPIRKDGFEGQMYLFTHQFMRNGKQESGSFYINCTGAKDSDFFVNKVERHVSIGTKGWQTSSLAGSNPQLY